MATRYAAFAVGLLLAAGCQQQQQPAMVDSLPPPNFDGPQFESPAPRHPLPERVVVAPPVKALPAPNSTSGVPWDWTPLARTNAWQWIVIHHSATPTGGAAAFDKMHRNKGWDELGYHFVIGNGTDTPDGRIEVGSRWPSQKWGAHAKTADNRFNEFGIGICLVGNFDLTRPSDAQLRSLSKLVAHLMKTYHVPQARVIGHGDTKATECPGRMFSITQVRRMSAQALAEAGALLPGEDTATAAASELLLDTHDR